MTDKSELETNESNSSLIVAPMEPQPDYFSDLKAYILSIVVDGVEPLPGPIVEDLVPYLRSLTEELSPPPPELLDRILDHFSENVSDQAEFENIRAHFIDAVMHEATPVDRNPLSFDGIEDLIQKITVRGDTSSAAAKLAVLLAQMFIRLRFRMPGNVRRHFARRGPFEVVQLDDAVLPISIPMVSAFNFDPNDPNKITGPKQINVQETVVPNRKVDVVTSDLAGFSVMMTTKKHTISLSDPRIPPELHGFRLRGLIGFDSVHTYADYDSLRRPWCIYGFTFYSPYIFEHRDHTKGLFLTAVARINLKHYSAFFDLP